MAPLTVRSKIGGNKLKQRVALAMVEVITVVVAVVIVKVGDGARVRREPVYGRCTCDTLTHLIDLAGGQDACGVHQMQVLMLPHNV